MENLSEKEIYEINGGQVIIKRPSLTDEFPYNSLPSCNPPISPNDVWIPHC